MSTRPQPRPRPRPRQKVPATDTAIDGASTTPGSSAQVAERDNDARFMKYTSDAAFKKLERFAKANENTQKRQSGSESEDSDDVEIISPRKKKHRKSTVKDKDAMPDWTKDPGAIVISSDDDLDDIILRDVENVEQSSTRTKQVPNSPKTRRRSRSRSITPPPALPAAVIQHARETVRRVMSEQLRSSSPDFEIIEDTEDSIVLDPELASIARKAEIHARRQESSTPGPGRSSSPIGIGGPDTVNIKVRWKPHPLNPNGKAQTLGFKMKRNDAFSLVFAECADAVSVPMANLILSYEGKRIYPSASPHGIGVWAEAELDACDKTTFQYLRTKRDGTPGFEIVTDRGRTPAGGSPPPASQLDEESAAGSDEDSDNDDTIRLTFRSAAVKDITLKVRQTTKCSAILKAYLKKAGLASKYPSASKKTSKTKGPALAVDGDRLNPNDEIGKADLEDGDQVEVVGL